MNAGGRSLACPYCGARAVPVAVHGHVQCAVCHTNIGPCCDGASAADEAAGTDASELTADPQLFARLFERLGGNAATVTTEALLFALVENQDTDLDGARLLLEAGLHTGVLEAAGPGGCRLRDGS